MSIARTWWSIGKVSAPEGSGSKLDYTEDLLCCGPVALTWDTLFPLGVEKEEPDQMSFDRRSKLRDSSQNSPRVASKLTKLAC
ncbi:hypothetical protein AVEN_95387-1 [Araneus ventricosus]|uniref:Uncharacterized protein n=1 Tax=Araneus ventricosus TaxID=182803 RepID=A0A4Y2CH31_ARAVE|nr:hypothetical protein AVEN_95387-1 [Araneus ventricosus]